MKDNKFPALVDPMNDIMMNGMPNLPQIIQSAMPKFIPPASYDQNPVSLALGNLKMGQLAKRAEREDDIARHTTNALVEKLRGTKAVVLFSNDIADSLDEFRHKKNVRLLFEKNIELTNNKLEVEIYKLQAEATTAGWESKMSELDCKVKTKQYSQILGDDHE
jgi:hypothetical protein